MKSNGSGPYCVPVGSNGTGTSKSSGSATSVSWYRDKGGEGVGPGGASVAAPGHIYENYAADHDKDDDNNDGVTQAIIHKESFESEPFICVDPDYDGKDSPPLDCNKTILSSKTDRTM